MSDDNDDQGLPDGWIKCMSKSTPGMVYYFNRKNGKSLWTKPKFDDKSKKKEKEKCRKQEKARRDEVRKKQLKRKSDGHAENDSRKRARSDNQPSTACKPPPITPTKSRKSASSSKDNTPATSTPKKSESSKTTPQNSANSRLAKLRAQLNAEIKDDDSEATPKKMKISPKTAPSDTPKPNRSELQSPSLNDTRNSMGHSPNSDSIQSIPSPSQFLAANKIISSMKAQLPEEYCHKEKQKDTFADIEKGICSQAPEYSVIKHPAIPPQFSEASKLVSAIKSKLSYRGSTSKEGLPTHSSAKERLEELRANLSKEADIENSDLCTSKDSLEAMEVEDFKEVKQDYRSVCPKTPAIQRTKCNATDDLVLVVDTNIFIHELNFIKTVLNSHIKGYSEQPTLLVPWRVINELDRLKDNNNGTGAICQRAKAAMDYLYKSLPENSRIKGQSLRDANSHIYPCESPDDEILNCSLQQAERGRNVILLSNDKNLCNKASINGVKRISIASLKGLVESKPQCADPGLRLALDHYENTMYELLANILENEMRASYNNLWQHVLFKAPPWTLEDVLQCLLKHWIAVFNEVFPRIEHLITDLKNTLASVKAKDPSKLSQPEVSSLKELCLDIATKCQIIPEYMQLAKATVDRLVRAPTDPDAHRERERNVVDAFEGLWTVFSSYCAKLSSALSIPHNLEDKVPTQESPAALVGKWTLMHSRVAALATALQGVLSSGDKVAEEQMWRLERAMREARQAAALGGDVGRGDLRIFCDQNRNMLQEACKKLVELTQLLELCGTNIPPDAK